jgi:flagellar basal-body rod modification protein FlgD
MTSVGNVNSPLGVPTTTGPSGAMDQTDFLRLMTTQLTTQDPFDPLDNTEMVAQMAQFSQVTGISEMNASLKTLVENMAAPGRLSDAASWIGRDVLVASDVAAPATDGTYRGEIALPDGAESVTISYVDANGVVVHTDHLGAQKPGTMPFTWNGENAAGETATAGPLKLQVTATVGDEVVQPAVATWTRVTGIQSPASGGATKLLTSLGALSADTALRLA